MTGRPRRDHGADDAGLRAPSACIISCVARACHIAQHPFDGDVVPHSGGIRKIRWRRRGTGKSSGVRVVYFTRNDEGEVVLLLIYAKAKVASISGQQLQEIRRALES